jgi:argininosuccinate synthase
VNVSTKKTVALAFSGGLDTSYCLVRLLEEGYDVTTVLVNTGGVSESELEAIRLRAEELGSRDHVVIDGRERLYDEFISYLLKANYLRNGVYPSCVGVERMLQAEEVTKLAISLKVDAIAHGSTGAGNDHVRFDAVIAALAPEIAILTPIRDEGINRETATSFLRARGIHAPDRTTRYSFNTGLMGSSIGGGETYSSWEYLPEDAWPATAALSDAPDEPDDLVISFERGLPSGFVVENGADRGCPSPGVALLAALNDLGERHGIGRGIHTGLTITGIGARLGFEAPGVSILIAAHRELERLTLSGAQQALKATIGTTFGDLLHEAHYYEPVLDDIRAFLDASQARVSGDVRIRLLKGHAIPLGGRSPFSIIAATSRLGTTYGHGSSAWRGEEMRAFARIFSIAGQVTREMADGGTRSEDGG